MPETALVAVTREGDREEAIVGHVMVSGAALRHETGERAIAMLSPLAVAPDHQRHSIGRALLRAVVRVADERGEPLVNLEGDPTYDGRFGFEHSLRHGIEITLPDRVPAEAAQVLPLSADDPDDATLRGRAVYPPAFDGVE